MQASGNFRRQAATIMSLPRTRSTACWHSPKKTAWPSSNSHLPSDRSATWLASPPHSGLAAAGAPSSSSSDAMRRFLISGPGDPAAIVGGMTDDLFLFFLSACSSSLSRSSSCRSGTGGRHTGPESQGGGRSPMSRRHFLLLDFSSNILSSIATSSSWSDFRELQSVPASSKARSSFSRSAFKSKKTLLARNSRSVASLTASLDRSRILSLRSIS